MKTRFLFFSLFLFSVASSAQESAEAPSTPPPAPGNDAGSRLFPQFFPGKIYNYVTETEVMIQLPGKEKTNRKVSMEHHSRLEVSERTAGPGSNTAGVAVEASTDRLKFKIDAAGRDFSYDSEEATDEAKENPLKRHFEGSMKRSMALELDEKGKIVSAQEKGGGGPATAFPGLPQFGPDELKQLVAGMVQGFPPDPVAAGDEWVQKGKRSLGEFGKIDFELTYRYTGDETYENADCAVIVYTGEMKGDVAVKGGALGSARGKLGFEGTQLKGRVIFDKLRKAVRLSEQTVNMRIDAPDPSGGGRTVQLPMQQSVVTKLVALQDR